MHRLWFLALATVLCLTLLAFPATQSIAAPGTNRHEAFVHFPETGHNVSFKFKDYFDNHGGRAILGLPLTEVFTDYDGLQAQYFENARLELHHDRSSGRSHIAGSLLGSQMAVGRHEAAFDWLAAAPTADREFFPESGHSIGGAFGWFWHSHGGVNVFGFPISEEFYEWDAAAGRERLVQYFQRARFVYHPELMGQPGEVTLSDLGRQFMQHNPPAMAHSAPVRPVELLGSATTGYAASISARIHNIGRATDMFHGLIVPAGEELSFNSVGEFTEENGFVDGYAIVGGRLEKVVGGGLCQVSTTLFRAASNAGLDITYRRGHTYIVNFYENILGFDATVYVPDIDFRFRNDTAGPVYITTRADHTTAEVTFAIYGYSDGRTISYDGPYTSNWVKPGRPVWQLDRSLPEGAIRHLVHGRSGVQVNLYRTVRLANGKVLHKDNYYTNYKPWEDFIAYGPGVTPPAGVTVLPAR
jgi:hypothetical protein